MMRLEDILQIMISLKQ